MNKHSACLITLCKARQKKKKKCTLTGHLLVFTAEKESSLQASEGLD